MLALRGWRGHVVNIAIAVAHGEPMERQAVAYPVYHLLQRKTLEGGHGAVLQFRNEAAPPEGDAMSYSAATAHARSPRSSPITGAMASSQISATPTARPKFARCAGVHLRQVAAIF